MDWEWGVGVGRVCETMGGRENCGWNIKRKKITEFQLAVWFHKTNMQANMRCQIYILPTQ